MEIILSLLIGIGLSATSGFRVFVPLLIMSIASLSGHLEFSHGFQWIGSYPALVIFLVATVIEVLAYFIPYLDNILSLISSPVSVIAGIIITASVVTGMSPLLTWTLAVIAGGGFSLAGKVTSNVVHTGSTTMTGGSANLGVSFVETVISTVMAVLSVLFPLLVILFVGIIGWVLAKMMKKMKPGSSQDFTSPLKPWAYSSPLRPALP
ncbi:DUF4126 domain-containing protein [Candidatus Contubernalis alkaliaceticus]|uniref:DUF4126 domain-containing protein n=1 Tax=Candidatus Contubernalis alkaliaceticus TaxID=338645 RepID=UPI001F4C24C9|nr:DUF4126 domain-containing protein [Candidatus Contubernalis alkalaceticus]UNC92111.1 DUF4126 domain-containing protein [Candidatus Contubernalis alkalaceticus]